MYSNLFDRLPPPKPGPALTELFMAEEYMKVLHVLSVLVLEEGKKPLTQEFRGLLVRLANNTSSGSNSIREARFIMWGIIAFAEREGLLVEDE